MRHGTLPALQRPINLMRLQERIPVLRWWHGTTYLRWKRVQQSTPQKETRNRKPETITRILLERMHTLEQQNRLHRILRSHNRGNKMNSSTKDALVHLASNTLIGILTLAIVVAAIEYPTAVPGYVCRRDRVLRAFW